MQGQPPLSSGDWPLPDRPYVPGRTRRHADDEPLFRVAHTAPALTVPAEWPRNGAWLGGLRAYSDGYFWEAHELWEPVWMHARPNSNERVLVQGLIQVANACLKLVMERPNAARRLVGIACQHFNDTASAMAAPHARLMGLEVDAAQRTTLAFALRLADQASPAAAEDRPPYAQFMQYIA